LSFLHVVVTVLLAAGAVSCAGARPSLPALPACPGQSRAPASVAGGPNGGGSIENPAIINRMAITRAMEREYRELLRHNGPDGVSGSARVWVLIDPSGAVSEARIQTSAGAPDLDRAALRVGRLYRFEPIRDGECAVAGWTSLSLTFQVGVR
jgi:TonB family protein